MHRYGKIVVFVSLCMVALSGVSIGEDLSTEPTAPFICSQAEAEASSRGTYLLVANPCGSNLNCGFNTGCAPGKYYCCPRTAPNLNLCNCSCYAKKNYDTTKAGGCNVWHNYK